MKITVKIGRDTLGDMNTETDNLNYVAAVETALAAEYPDADISVSLAEHSKTFTDSSDDDQSVVDNVNDIANRIWDRANY